MTILFISDAHLNERDVGRQEKLVAFLQSFEHLERLYIMGDLFDFWFGYKTVIFRYFIPIICQLHRLVNSGTELVYVLGNHDFYLGPLFSETIPMRIIAGESIETIGSKSVLLLHGDGIDTSDYGYRFLRFVVRRRMTQFIFRWIHPDLGWRMARLLSKSSRTYTSWKQIDRKKVYLEFGIKKVQQGIDLCVMGHSHLPFMKRVERSGSHGFVINLGDWIDNLTYLQYKPNEGFRLYRYNPSGSHDELPLEN